MSRTYISIGLLSLLLGCQESPTGGGTSNANRQKHAPRQSEKLVRSEPGDIEKELADLRAKIAAMEKDHKGGSADSPGSSEGQNDSETEVDLRSLWGSPF